MKFLAGIVGFFVYPPASLIRSGISSVQILFGISFLFPYKIAKNITDSLVARLFIVALSSAILTFLSAIIALPLLPIFTVLDVIRSFFIGASHGFRGGFSKLWDVIINKPDEISLLSMMYGAMSESVSGSTDNNINQGHTQAMLDQFGNTAEMNTTFDFSKIKAAAPENKALSNVEIQQIESHLLITTNDETITTLRSSFKQYNELLNKLNQKESEIIPFTDIEKTKIILFREYCMDDTWKIDSTSMHIGELESSQEWFKQRATHPLNREDLREPKPVSENGVEYPTRYRWQEYDPKNRKGFQLLNEYSDSIRAQIKELGSCPSLLPETTANDDEDGHDFISPALR